MAYFSDEKHVNRAVRVGCPMNQATEEIGREDSNHFESRQTNKQTNKLFRHLIQRLASLAKELNLPAAKKIT